MFMRANWFSRSISWLLAVMILLFSVLFAAIGQVNAIARGYETNDDGLRVGMVAALSTEGDSRVERADQSNSKRVVGVVTTFGTSSVTLASGESKVLVETEGEIDVYISDMGGEVNQGNLLVLSPLKGILMKANDGSIGPVVAIAAENSSSASETSTYSYEDKGKEVNTRITKLKVNLNQQGTSGGQASPDSALAKLGQSVVGKDIGEIRVLIALIIFIIVLIAEGGIIYGAVTSSITALGRNPMARKIIKREMIQVIVVALVVLVVGLGAVYGILWI